MRRRKKKPLSKRRLLKLLRNRCSRLWRQCVLARWGGKCAICGETHLANCHHIIPREFASLRFNPNNGIVLCPQHHRLTKWSAHVNPVWFVRKLEAIIDSGVLHDLVAAMHSDESHPTEWTVEYYENVARMLEDDLLKMGGGR